MNHKNDLQTPGGALALVTALLLTGCAAPMYHYRYAPGKSAHLHNGHAIAPVSAPPQVRAAITAGNQIAGSPYAHGGGHRPGVASAYDCSGAASYVLQRAGLLASPMPSNGFRRYGAAGPGKWITVCARRDHVFLVIAGLRFDTGFTGGRKGPQWTARSRPAPRSVLRHPPGL